MSDAGAGTAVEQPLHVRVAADASRYEATLGKSSELAAILEYRWLDRGIALLHTEVLPEYEGQGVGSRFARGVFADLRARELKVIPKCPFIVRWLERHPEEHDLLARPLDPSPPASGDGLESV